MQERRLHNKFSLSHFFSLVLFSVLPPTLHCLYPCFTSSFWSLFISPVFFLIFSVPFLAVKFITISNCYSCCLFQFPSASLTPFMGFPSRSWHRVAPDDDDPAKLRELWTAENYSWSKHGTCSEMNFPEKEVWYKWETFHEIVEICFTSIMSFFSLNTQVSSIYCTKGFSLHCVQRTSSKNKTSSFNHMLILQ